MCKLEALEVGMWKDAPFFRSRCTMIFSVTKEVVALMRADMAVFTAATCSRPRRSGMVPTP